MLPEEIKHKLAILSRPAWRPRVGPAVPGARSKFGGLPLLKPNEAWPCCGHCHQPMQLFVQLDSLDLPVEARSAFGDGVLQVFYCTNAEEDCEVLGHAHLPFSDATLVRVIPRQQAKGFDALPVNIPDAFIEQSLTGWQWTADFPDRQEPVANNEDVPVGMGDLLQSHHYAPRSGDKFLGWPHWVGEASYPLCSCCNKTMKFILQMGSADTLPFWFGNSGYAYVFQCETNYQMLTMSWEGRP
ncbi:DUF1963 domain-containing protein [Alcanivorax sp.]|jgi:hypothetical protein|uniref:DUF1963 domain-containing protein n=1 Tax=Alcanivorax sp. TaxID=1872427 RepID=UPI0032D8BEE1